MMEQDDKENDGWSSGGDDQEEGEEEREEANGAMQDDDFGFTQIKPSSKYCAFIKKSNKDDKYYIQYSSANQSIKGEIPPAKIEIPNKSWIIKLQKVFQNYPSYSDVE